MKKFALLLCAFVALLAAGEAWAAMSDKEFFELCETDYVDDILRAIQDGANVNAKKGDGTTVLMWAIEKYSKPEIISALINAGADVNAKKGDGTTVLMWAAYENPNPEIIAALINAGADVNAKNQYGDSALHRVLYYGSTTGKYYFDGFDDIVQALVKAGADVNARDDDGMTPLMMTSRPTISSVLIKAGADVNARDDDGMTPLMHSARRGGGNIKVLIDAGADINAKDNNGYTALYYAKQNNLQYEIENEPGRYNHYIKISDENMKLLGKKWWDVF